MGEGTPAKQTTSRHIGKSLISVSVGDIASMAGVDAIVNPTTRSLRLDGRVSAAICGQADRESLSFACASLAPLEIGESGITPSFGLHCSRIIHCHGPRFLQPDSADALARTYSGVLDLAEREGLTSIAIPALSTGSLGFPMSESARIAVEVIKDFSPDFCNLHRIEFVLPTRASAEAFIDELLRPVQLPALRTAIDIGVRYTPDEIEAMRQGHYGDLTTKWFFYFEEPWLCIYRGNRTHGRCHFLLRLPSFDSPAPIEEAWVCAALPDPDYPWAKEEVEDLIRFLLDDRFGLLEMPSASEHFGGASLCIKRGKIALSSSVADLRALLSVDEARALGTRLLVLAESLGKSN
jgi:O-acetyl-ADP-ribose deacetylase (regulator of RNase III)